MLDATTPTISKSRLLAEPNDDEVECDEEEEGRSPLPVLPGLDEAFPAGTEGGGDNVTTGDLGVATGGGGLNWPLLGEGGGGIIPALLFEGGVVGVAGGDGFEGVASGGGGDEEES